MIKCIAIFRAGCCSFGQRAYLIFNCSKICKQHLAPFNGHFFNSSTIIIAEIVVMLHYCFSVKRAEMSLKMTYNEVRKYDLLDCCLFMFAMIIFPNTIKLPEKCSHCYRYLCCFFGENT